MDLKKLIAVVSLLQAMYTSSTNCHQDLLISYGLEGLQTSQPQTLDMCKMVTHSCCKVSDQLSMYSNWQTSGEEKNLEARFKYHQTVYFDLLDLLDSVTGLARRVLDRLIDRRISNCKVLAKRILHFQVSEITPKLKDTIVNMHEFFKNTYKGFYCTLCDAASHKHFSIQANKVNFSQKFCRDITANSLHVLLYFHVHFLKYMNLIARFVNSCDHKGAFVEKPIDESLTFIINVAQRTMLDECKSHRNDPNWFEYCYKICQEFNMVKYTKFFEPNIKEFSSYTLHLKGMVAGVLEEEEKERKFLEGVGEEKKTRVLAETGNLLGSNSRVLSNEVAPDPSKQITPEKLAQVKNEYTNPLIFKSGLNAIVDLGEFNSRFEEEGINYFDNGKQSEITDSRYNSVKALVKLTGPPVERKTMFAQTLLVIASSFVALWL